MKKLLFFIIFSLLGFFGFIQITKQVVLREIQSDRPYDPFFETRSLSSKEEEEVQKALHQEYTYFGSGGQAYVFFSEDGKYVIKFFKQRHFREPKYLDYIPFITHYRTLKYEKRKQRIRREYGSYKMGFEDLHTETALLYIHLNKTSHLKKNLIFKDRFHIQHAIDLDKTDFILQRRAQLVTDNIQEAMRDNRVTDAQKTISSVLSLVVTFCKKGYHDRDPQISKNCGIIDGQAIKIDVGRFLPNSKMTKPLFFKPTLYRVTRPFRNWLKENHPELVDYLDREIVKVLKDD